jgi:hypothetical protein
VLALPDAEDEELHGFLELVVLLPEIGDVIAEANLLAA